MKRTGVPILAVCFVLSPLPGHADMCPPEDQRKAGGPFLSCEAAEVLGAVDSIFDLFGFSYDLRIGASSLGKPLARVALTFSTSYGRPALPPMTKEEVTKEFADVGPQIATVLGKIVCGSSDYGAFVRGGGEIEFTIRYPVDDAPDFPAPVFSTIVTSCEAP